VSQRPLPSAPVVRVKEGRPSFRPSPRVALSHALRETSGVADLLAYLDERGWRLVYRPAPEKPPEDIEPGMEDGKLTVKALMRAADFYDAMPATMAKELRESGHAAEAEEVESYGDPRPSRRFIEWLIPSVIGTPEHDAVSAARSMTRDQLHPQRKAG
jgi:hypothetical protein